jgi:hypothetical protein
MPFFVPKERMIKALAIALVYRKGPKWVRCHTLRRRPADVDQDRDIANSVHLLNAGCIHVSEA